MKSVYRYLININAVIGLALLTAFTTIGVKILDIDRDLFLFLVLFTSLVVGISLVLKVLVSQKGFAGANLLNWVICFSISLILWQTSLVISVNNFPEISMLGKSFTKYDGKEWLVKGNPRFDHEKDKIVLCELGGSRYCLEARVDKYVNYRNYMVCYINGDLFYKRKQDINKYDLLKNTYLKGFDVQIKCKEGNNLWYKIINFRDKSILYIKSGIKEPQSLLLSGILFGVDFSYDDIFEKSVKAAGLSHIVAASGYNVTILINAIDKVFFFLKGKSKDLLKISFIWIYALITGFASSMVRASLMSSLLIISKSLSFSLDTKDIFKWAFFLILLSNPMYSFDIGFQLSVAATFGLIYISPIFERYRLTKMLSPQTLACTICTLPIAFFHFQALSIYSLFANILVLPLIELTMIMGIMGLIIKPILYVVWGNLKVVEMVSKFVLKLPFSILSLSTKVSTFLVLVMIILIIFMVYKNAKFDNSSN